jgi:hypothetical protein
MSHENGKDESFTTLDASAGLYHEAQADGVPYDEDSEPFTAERDNDSRR